MFGPLNGVRTALVILAFATAVVAAVLGQWLVSGVLLAGVALHGLGWRYLWRQKREGGDRV